MLATAPQITAPRSDCVFSLQLSRSDDARRRELQRLVDDKNQQKRIRNAANKTERSQLLDKAGKGEVSHS